jgi:hypothetical protein
VTLPQLADVRALPLWAGYALTDCAVAIAVLGTRGARVMNAALLGTGAFCACFYGLRGHGLHDWVPGVSAIVAGGIFAVAGFASLWLGTGLVMAVAFLPLGYFSARYFKLAVEVPVGCSFIVGFCFGAINRNWISLVLAPVVSAAMLLVGVERIWRPAVPQLWKLVAAGIVAMLLLVLFVERNHRAKLRAAAKSKRVSDAQLKAKLTAQQAAFRRSQQG